MSRFSKYRNHRKLGLAHDAKCNFNQTHFYLGILPTRLRDNVDVSDVFVSFLLPLHMYTALNGHVSLSDCVIKPVVGGHVSQLPNNSARATSPRALRDFIKKNIQFIVVVLLNLIV